MSCDEPEDHEQHSSLAHPRHGITQGQRNRDIDDFVKSFNAWDWLYLRSKVRQAKIDSSQLASFDNLPVDIVSLIATYLTLSEVSYCRLVSQQWYSLWTDPAVINSLLLQHFPGALECMGRSMSPAKVLFQLNRQHSKPVGHGWTVSDVSSNMGPEAKSTTSRQGVISRSLPPGVGRSLSPFIYAAGKVAWQPMPSFVVIDDLISGTWKRISFLSNRLHGISPTLIGFNGILLVVGHGGPEWPVTRASFRKVSHKAITLPNNLEKCFTHDETVVFVTRGSEVFVYKWGQVLKQVKFSMDEGSKIAAASTQEVYALLSHPLEPETMFLVSAELPCRTEGEASWQPRTSEVHFITVTKYQKEQIIRKQTVPVSAQRPQLTGYVANRTGLYSICKGLASRENCQTVTLMYNVVTERLYQMTAGIHQSGQSERIWNSHILNDAAGNSPEVLCLMATRCGILGTAQTPDILDPTPVPEVAWKDQVHHTRSAGTLPICSHPTLNLDDEFVILRYQGGYVVLSAEGRRVYLKELGGDEDNVQ